MLIGRRTAIKRAGQAMLMAGTAALAGVIGLERSTLAQISGHWLEVSRILGPVTYQGQGRRNARQGDRLEAPGHSIITGNNASAVLDIDSNIGTVTVAANTQLAVQRLGITSSGGRITLLDVVRGQARVQVRSFTNPDSRLELHTPSGIAAVRGTEFGVSVSDTGQTMIGTLEGTVEASAQGQSVSVTAGLASSIRPGEPPTAPQPLDRELTLEVIDLYRRDRVIRLKGRINPTNRLWLDGEEVAVGRSGRFVTTVSLPHRHRSLGLTVVNPLGESRDYHFPAWRLDDLDQG